MALLEKHVVYTWLTSITGIQLSYFVIKIGRRVPMSSEVSGMSPIPLLCAWEESSLVQLISRSARVRCTCDCLTQAVHPVGDVTAPLQSPAHVCCPQSSQVLTILTFCIIT